MFGFPIFEQYCKSIRAIGIQVWSPHERDLQDGFDPGKDEALPLENYLKVDIQALCAQDAIACIPNWRDSEGAQKEVTVAQWCGMPVLDAETLRPVRKETILEEAERIVSGGRNLDYGHPRDDFTCIAEMWNAYLKKRRKPLSPRDVAMFMVMVKVAREANQPKRDSLVDISGYARCAERLDEPCNT